MFGTGSTGSLGMGVAFSLHDNFTANSKKISTSMKTLEGVTAAVSANVTRGLNKMKLGFAALVGAAVLLLPLGHAISKSMEYNQVMSEVKAKSSAAGAQMDVLRKQTFNLGKATKFSAKEVGEGQAFLAMAGFKTNKILSAMPSLLDLAAAGNLDLARASDIASNILTQFNLEASQMPMVADVIAHTATTANTSVEQMSEAMKFFGPTAAAFKMDLQESAAMIGFLGNAGQQGSIATRALGTSLARLTDPTNEMNREMKKIEFSAFDDLGNFKGMVGVVANLEQGLEGLSTKERQKAISIIFGPALIQEVNSLLSATKDIMVDGNKVVLKGADAFAEYSREIEGSAGAAKRMADTMMDNLAGDIILLKSLWDTTMIDIGTSLEPILRPLVVGLTKLVSLGSKFVGTRVGKAVMIVVGAIGLLVGVIGTYLVVSGFATFASAKLAIGFASMGLTAVSSAFAVGGLTAGVSALGVAIWTALAPLLPIIAAIALAITPIILLTASIRSFNHVLDGTEEKADGFKGFMQKVGGVFVGLGQIFKTWNGEFFTMSDNMKSTLEDMGILKFVLALGTGVVRVKNVFIGMWATIKESFEPVGESLSIIWNALKKLKPTIQPLLDLFKPLIGDAEIFTNIGRKMGSVIALSMKLAIWPILLMIKSLEFVITHVKSAIQYFGDLLGYIRDISKSWLMDNIGGLVQSLGFLLPDNMSIGESNDSVNNTLVNEMTQNSNLKLEPSVPVVNNTHSRTVESVSLNVAIEEDVIVNRIIEVSRLNDSRNG